jgi:hypothetical protein
MALPLTWVDRIFDKLVLAYGRDFTGRWEGIPMASVKGDWAHELAGFEEHPDSIKHALQSLPPAKPPTVYEFRNIAANAPRMANKQLPSPPQDMERVNLLIGGLRQTVARHDMKDWAHRLKARHESGDKISPYQIHCYQNALRVSA